MVYKPLGCEGIAVREAHAEWVVFIQAKTNSIS